MHVSEIITFNSAVILENVQLCQKHSSFERITSSLTPQQYFQNMGRNILCSDGDDDNDYGNHNKAKENKNTNAFSIKD